MRAAVLAVLLGLVTTPAWAQSAGVSGAPITLAELQQIALENNPTTRAAQAGIEVARGLARQAGAWPNPVVGYTGEEITTRDPDPRGEHGFFVEQTIPLGGKLRLSRQVFERAVERAEAGVDLQRQRILSSVRTLFYEILTAERRVEVHEGLATLASEAVGITAQLFNVGAADRPDHLASEVEARRIQLELNGGHNRVFALRQQLAAVVGSADVAAQPLSGSIDQAIPELERNAIIRALVDDSPQMRAARAEVARAQAVTARARRETFPNLFLRGGAAYNREQGENTRLPIGWEGQVEAGISIPVFNRNQGGVAAARADESRAQSDLRRVELSLRARAAAEFATYLTALRESESYRDDILPRAGQAYQLYLARYREMGAAYPQVLVAQRTLIEMSRAYLESLENAWRSGVRLQGFLAGEGLDAPDVAGDQFVAMSDDQGRER